MYAETALDSNKIFLRIAGLWPEDTRRDPLRSMLKGYILCTVTAALTTFSIFLLYARTADTVDLAKKAVDSIGMIQISAKVLPLFTRRDKILDVLKETKMRTTMTNFERRIMKEWMDLRLIVTKCVVVVYTSMFMTYICIPFVISDQLLPLRMDVPSGFLNGDMYKVTYLTEVVVCLMMLLSILPSDILFIFFSCYLCSELQCTAAVMRSYDGKRPYLKTILNQHVATLKYGERVCRIMSVSMFAQNCIYTSMICVACFVILTNDNTVVMKMGMVLITTILQLLINCYVGDMISQASLEMPYAIDDCDWPSAIIEDRRSLAFALMRSQRPLSLGVGRFGEMNLDFFTRSLYTAISNAVILASLS